jgi:hypothetical protein
MLCLDVCALRNRPRDSLKAIWDAAKNIWQKQKLIENTQNDVLQRAKNDIPETLNRLLAFASNQLQTREFPVTFLFPTAQFKETRALNSHHWDAFFLLYLLHLTKPKLPQCQKIL